MVGMHCDPMNAGRHIRCSCIVGTSRNQQVQIAMLATPVRRGPARGPFDLPIPLPRARAMAHVQASRSRLFA